MGTRNFTRSHENACTKVPGGIRSRRLLEAIMVTIGAILCLFSGRAVAQTRPGQQTAPGIILPAPKSVSGYVPGRIMVKFKEGLTPSFTKGQNYVQASISEIDNLNRQYGCTAAKRVFTGRKSNTYLYTFDFPATANVQQLVKAYQASGVVADVTPDYLVGNYTTTPNDPEFYKSWGLYNSGLYIFSGVTSVAGRDIDAKLAWDLTTGSSSVTVAVIDAGMKLDHPEFSGRVWTNTGEIAGNGIDDDGNGYIDDYQGWDWVNNDNNPTDDNGHGTNVAGIIGANGNNSDGYAGVDWHCKLMCLKTQGSTGTGSTSSIISAVYYATDKGAKVINMSLGGYSFVSSFQDAINYAYSSNVTVVAAMGNDDTSGVSYPAGYNHVIAVGATRCDDHRASFSNYGSHISVVAPGEAIFGLSYLSNTDYSGGMSGTSQATPHVAGVAALMLALDPSKTPDQIKAIIEATAEDMVGVSTEDVAGFDIYYGHGRLNAYQALLYCTTPNAITGTTTICVGASSTLSTTTTGGTWSSSAASIATVNSSGVITGVASGIATITYKKLACYRTINVTIKPTPSSVSVSPSSGSTCLGSGASVTASATAGAVTLVNQDWNDGLMDGWVVTNNNTTGATGWQVRSSPGYGGAATGDGSAYVEAAPDASSANTKTILTSPPFSTVGYSSASLTYNQYFTSYAAGDTTVAVQYSIDGGSTWTTLVNQLGTSATTSTWSPVTPQITVSLPAAALGVSNLKLRWNYNSTFGYYWAVDNITVKGSGSLSYAWSGIGGATGISCSSCATTTLTPAATGANVYSVTATSSSCSASSGTTITAISAPASISGTATVCVSGTTTLTNTVSGGTWQSATPGIATVNSSGVVTGVTGGTVTISYFNTCGTATKIVTVNAAPAAIGGSGVACVGGTTTLTNTTAGGTWMTSDATVAIIGSSSGIVTGAGSGNAIITYTTTCGTATKTVTINSAPAAIAGPSTVCVASTITLTDVTGGGTWSSSVTGIASVGSSSGIVTGNASGTATISYTTTCGTVTRIVTVNAAAAAGTITGTASLCTGFTTSLSSTVSGGTWSSSNLAIASIGSSNGLVSGLAGGTATTTYTVISSCGTATATQVVTVNSLPSPITGTLTLCAASSTTLSSTTSGGSWTSGTTAVATTGSGTGIVTGVAGGTSEISYTLSTGCRTTAVVTVNSLPSAIGGAGSICNSSCATLTDASSGGVWTSANPLIASVNATGIVCGASAGTVNITYTLPTGCLRSAVVTVNPLASLSGAATVCEGATTTFSSTIASGTWSSASPATASVTGFGASSGVVTGISFGATTITYVTPAGCLSTKDVTVNTTTSAGTISGPSTVCVSGSVTLSSTVTGGTWSSSDPTVATVSTSTGVVAGVTGGSALITYTVTNSCGTSFTTTSISSASGSSAGSILGTLTVCPAGTTTLSNTVSGGSWFSGNSSVATVDGSGTVTGIASGTAAISYAVFSSCGTSYATAVVTVNSTTSAGSITGPSTVCLGGSATLSNTISGGSWSSSDGSVISVVGGIITGASLGSATISYTVTNACGSATASKLVMVNTTASAGTISGASTVCLGGTTTFTSTASGGVWSSSNPAASVGSSTGIVNGVLAGSAIISYSVTNSCGTAFNTAGISVISAPSAGSISGTLTVCPAGTTLLSNTISGGSWFSSNSSVASVDGSGNVLGIAAGTSTISYAVFGSCGTGYATAVVTVSATPSAGTITGASSICPGTTATFTDGITGGIWHSSDTSVVTVSAGGVVLGIATGSAMISYTVISSCGSATATKFVAVNSTPSAGTLDISGTVCVGTTATVSSTVSGGTWSSSPSSIASISSASGVVTGVNTGSAIITYTISNSCGSASVTTPVTVLGGTSGGAITGSAAICVGGSTTLSNTVSGGEWSSSAPSIAVALGTGEVQGVATGTAIISYVKTGSCGSAVATKVVTVTATPVAGTIGGPTSVSEGGSITLTSTVSGGTFSGSNSRATVSASGMVTGIASGSVIVTYTVSNGCGSVFTTYTVGVNAVVPAISGSFIMCVGNTATASNSLSGGTWSSNNTAIATVDGSGVVTGVAIGNAYITYTVAGGYVTAMVTVSNTPSAITGSMFICQGATTTLHNAASGGGTWTSNDLSIATIGASNGALTGVSAGTVNIVYTLGTGCSASAVITVNGLPAAITGMASACSGSTAALGSATTGGVWSSNHSTVATVDASGVVTGIGSGIATISYTTPAGCYTSITFTTNALPAAITGVTSVCAGSAKLLSSTTLGGSWSSSDLTVATIGTGGAYTGVAAGTATITYTLGTGCNRTTGVTVNAIPVISGSASVCPGSTTALLSSISGGSWTGGSTTVATVGSTGIVTGIAAGTTNISYSASGCASSTVVTVSAAAAAITGTSKACVGASTTLSCITPGGSWTSSDNTIATVGSADGIVNGVGAGTLTITYGSGAGCTRTTIVSINALPDVITGTTSVCPGSSSLLSSTSTGGSWTSSALPVATVGTSGTFTGVGAGTANITYMLSTGCSRTASVTVNAIPVISGATPICPGGTIALTGSVPGGAWSGGDAAVATVGATGVVTGIAPGNNSVTYTTAAGCSATSVITVTATAAAITGTNRACLGSSATLSCATTGGSWTSSDNTIATIGSATGIFTGAGAGTATISYVTGAGCASSTTVTIDAAPAAITGILSTCLGSTTSLSNAGSGAWTSSNTSVATIASSGVVTGVTTGVATITFTAGAMCVATAQVTVNGAPAAIAGPATSCTGSVITLTNTVPGGVWSSSNPAIATVDPSTGVVTGVAYGIAGITYSTGAACYKLKNVSINVGPTVSGYPVACVGLTTTLSGGGGTWASGNPAVATITTSGYATGVAAGTAVMTFTATSTGCASPYTVTVVPAPTAIAGPSQACQGSSITLSNTTPGGSWTSANTAVATVGSATGIVTAAGSGGSTTISYSIGTGCRVTTTFTARAVPAAFTGVTSVCMPATATIMDVTAGGTWSSSDASVATIGSAIQAGNGVMTGVSAGTTNVTYTLTATGCYRSTVVTVNAGLSPGTITSSTGAFTLRTVSAPTSLTLSSTGAPGGTWTSSNPAVATINSSTGFMASVAAGSTTVTYSVTSGVCTNTVTRAITVSAGRDGNSYSSSAAALLLYPNPTTGAFTLNADEAGTMTVYTIDGKSVYSFDVAAGITEHTTQQGMAAGIYMCRFTSQSGNTTIIRLVLEQ